MRPLAQYIKRFPIIGLRCGAVVAVLAMTMPVRPQTNADAAHALLIEAIAQKPQLTARKESRIAKIKEGKGDLSLIQEYDFNNRLVNEYRKFKLDSAIAYANRNVQIAKQLNRHDLQTPLQLQLVPLYSSSGLFREAEALLKETGISTLNGGQLADYYEAYSQFFAHYAANHNLSRYRQQVEAYRDSLLNVLDTLSFRYRVTLAEKNLALGLTDVAERDLLKLMAIEDEGTPNHAMISYLLGNVYLRKGKVGEAKRYFALSAVSDIENSIKDNASIRILALIYYEMGDIDNAYLCTKSAIEDAVFCNAQFRTLLMSEVYNIINAAYLDKEAARKSQLQFYLIVLGTLAFLLVLAVALVYRQMKRLARIKEELSATTSQLAQLNHEISLANSSLQERNALLSEANHVKEEYIAQFFDLCSTYINKLEQYRVSLNKKAITNQYDELFKMLKSTTLVDDELEELYRIFDNIFLNLYPSFVSDFNNLLAKDEQVVPKQGELLNTELRIYALIRLGITDSVKIASFLRYSLSAIYNYRTRARNKAAVSRNEFEQLVMRIGNPPQHKN